MQVCCMLCATYPCHSCPFIRVIVYMHSARNSIIIHTLLGQQVQLLYMVIVYTTVCSSIVSTAYAQCNVPLFGRISQQGYSKHLKSLYCLTCRKEIISLKMLLQYRFRANVTNTQIDITPMHGFRCV